MMKINIPSLRVTKIRAVTRMNVASVHTALRQNRPCWAVSVKLAGKTAYISNGKKHISDSDHIVLLPKGASYKIAYEELGECFIIEFDADYIGDTPDVTSYTVNKNHDFANRMINRDRLWTFKKPACELHAMSGLYYMLAKLHETETAEYYSSDKYKIIEPAIKHLEQNFADPELSSEELAHISDIICVYFRKLFSKVFGESPMRYLQSVRIEKAKALLRGDYMPITDIAENVGFKSIYHFSKTFKKITGYTPSEYTKKKGM